MRDLERELRALLVDWPATPDVAGRLALPARRRRPRARWAAAAVALLLGGLAAVEPARSAVLELLGLKSVRIERREPVATPQPAGSDLGLGRPVSPAAAARIAPPPRALGPATGAFRGPGRAITYVYGNPPDVLVTQVPGVETAVLEKAVGRDARIERFRVDGDPAYLISGARHGVAFAGPDGTIRVDQQRLAGNTLLVERGGALIRVEGELARDRAVAIARSIP